MTDPARIILDPTILAGKAVIRGTRLSVDFVIGLIADGWNDADIYATIRDFPTTILRLASPTLAMC